MEQKFTTMAQEAVGDAIQSASAAGNAQVETLHVMDALLRQENGVLLVLFMLLTAYDTQKLQQMYAYYAGDPELAEKASIYGALTLYLDFINIFLYVVRLLGNNRRRN